MKLDLIGQQFGHWTVLHEAKSHTYPSGQHRRQWTCRCVCGREVEVVQTSLRNGASTNCGCIRDEGTARRMRVHGDCRTPEYSIWQAMKSRCLNSKNSRYADYGGRGIRVCDRWLNDYAAFFADMGPRPSPRHTLDRKRVNGDYEPDNCRWATPKEQAKNKRRKYYADDLLPSAFGVIEPGFL